MARALSIPSPPWWSRMWRWLTGGGGRGSAEVAQEVPLRLTARLNILGHPIAARPEGKRGVVATQKVPPPLVPAAGPWTYAELPAAGEPDAVRPGVLGRLWYTVAEAPPEDRPFLERLARELDGGVIAFPLFPDAALKLDRFLRSGEPTVTHVAGIVRVEPELVRRIWEAASGAAYGRRSAKTLDEAIVRLGLDAVWRVAMGACVHSPVFRIPAFQAQCDTLRAVSPVIGTVANALAPGGDAWLAGLLHDVGRLFVYRVATARGHVVADRQRVDEIAVRHAPSIGMLIAANWGLQPAVVNALAFLPDPGRAPIEHREVAIALRAAVLAVYQVVGERKGLDYGAYAGLRVLPTRAFTPERALAEAEKAWVTAHPPR